MTHDDNKCIVCFVLYMCWLLQNRTTHLLAHNSTQERFFIISEYRQQIIHAAAPGAVDYRLMLGWERTDFAALSRLFLGPCGQRALVYLTAAQCYTVLWAYTSVISSSLASIVFEYGGLENGRCVMPLDKPTNAAHCELVYYVCVGAFATLVVPLTMLDIEEQANVQLALTAYRFLALGVMIVTLLISMAQTTDVQTRTFAPALRDDVDWTGFAVVFNAAAVVFNAPASKPTSTNASHAAAWRVQAFNFQLNMPDALRPLADKVRLSGRGGR